MSLRKKRASNNPRQIEMIDLGSQAEEKKSKKARREPEEKRNPNLTKDTTSSIKKSRKKNKEGRSREYLIITYLFLALFLGMIAYFVYFQVYRSDSVINNSYNSRLNLYADRVVRGDIVSSDGVVLATTEVDGDGNETRVFPERNKYAHAVGFFTNGKSGLEAQYNFMMLRSHSFFLKQVINDITDQKNTGDTLVSSLDSVTQTAAYNALGDYRGAVVVMEVSTGRVIAMVSKPDFDPNTIAANWDSIISDNSSSVLLNRATGGLYPPGSIFKVFTTLEYMHENIGYEKYQFDCQGTLDTEGYTIHCYHGQIHGVETLRESFAHSCNTSYANIGLSLDIDRFNTLLNDCMFNKSLPGSLSANNSSFKLSKDDNDAWIMQTAIGQGDTLVTPIHMCWIASAIANDGIAMNPYMVDKVENDSGITVKKYRSSQYGEVMSVTDAVIMQDYMSSVVANGTASALSGQSYKAAGKTGSAEYNSNGDSHGWFIGYGSKDGYNDIAIAVVVENGGSGSSSAVPVAKKVFDTYFNK